MSGRSSRDEATDLVTRAALQARLEIVTEELDRAVERLTAVVEDIKAQDNADCDEGGDDDDERGTAS